VDNEPINQYVAGGVTSQMMQHPQQNTA